MAKKTFTKDKFKRSKFTRLHRLCYCWLQTPDLMDFSNPQSKCLKFFSFWKNERIEGTLFVGLRAYSTGSDLCTRKTTFLTRETQRVHIASRFPASWWLTSPLSCCFEPAHSCRHRSKNNIVWSEMKTSPDPTRPRRLFPAVRGRREVQRSVERGNDALCFPIILTPRSDAHGTRHPTPRVHEEDIQPLEGSTVLSSNLRSCQSNLPMLENKKERNGHDDSQEKPEQMISNQQHFCATWQQRVNQNQSTATKKASGNEDTDLFLFLSHHLRTLFCVEEQLDSLKHFVSSHHFLNTKPEHWMFHLLPSRLLSTCTSCVVVSDWNEMSLWVHMLSHSTVEAKKSISFFSISKSVKSELFWHQLVPTIFNQ